MNSHREALLSRVAAADERMRALLAYDRTNPLFSVNLTMQQLKVLMLLSRHDGIASAELTRRLGVSLATLSGIVDRLVTQGYVMRTEDQHDRRIRRIHLSPAGRAVLNEIAVGGTQAQQRLLSRLDDETLGMLAHVLERVIEAAAADIAEQTATQTQTQDEPAPPSDRTAPTFPIAAAEPAHPH
ncbi:MarR family winged helix-turn-helix transcriptional regulator [Dactylosporangium sp. NPDC051541]|uniref:MarR family winged helix-turn-helix transcriptional regulator n=1 Tax=Dactylosporangium sp. NPDC051541 TaxID=3363977 RepID=UPI0037A904E4